VISGWRTKRPDGRLISICSGAAFLANAGELDGRAATSHWSRKDMLLSRFPNVRWDLNKIYILSDTLFTSAGVSTGVDLALAIIRRDCGASAALEVAQELVVYVQRPGGQSQFSGFLSSQFKLDSGLGRLVDEILQAPELDWKLDLMADKLSMNSRTLSRRFSVAMSMSPVRFVEKIRLDLARQFLSSGMPLKRAAVASGFGDIQRMRRSFQRQIGVNPEDYAERFGDAGN
jgi:transcriptional regulator GlxA family with amidase domain